MDALWRTIGDPHAHGGEGGLKRYVRHSLADC
jgi:hypothetical protein